MKHIVVIGGGIAGLTAAHELIEQNYKVTIIERNNEVGGLARTYQNEDDKTCPYEYSWRAFGAYYQNVYNIMKRIQYDEKNTVYDKLVVINEGVRTCSKHIPNYYNSLSFLSATDILKLLPTLINYYVSSEDRNIKSYSNIGLRDTIKKLNLSKNAEDAIGKTVGPYLGFDYHNASLYDLLYYNEMENNNSEENFYITSLPTSFVWFEPWVRLLKKKGVVILTHTEVKAINITNNTISSIIVRDLSNNMITNIKADYYASCMGPEALEKLLNPYRTDNKIRKFYSNISKVATNGRQIQLSVYYYLDKKIFLDNQYSCAYLPNTPWLLMVLPTGHIWGDSHMKKFCNPQIKEILSIGICEPYEKGLYIKKPWSECTREEIRIETWYQLINDINFIQNICIEDNIKLEEVNVIDFKMWDSFIYKDGVIDTYEPKWANNIGTAAYRPNSVSCINNLFIAGAYTNTSVGIFSMESATESGKIVAKTICKYDNKSESIYLHTKKKNILSAPIRFIDSLLYNANIFVVIILCIIIIFTANKLSNKKN